MWPVGSSRIPRGENIPDLQQAQPIEADQRYLLSKLIYGDVAMIFAFTSIAVLNTLIMIARRRGPEFALLRLVGLPHARSGRWRAGRPS